MDETCEYFVSTELVFQEKIRSLFDQFGPCKSNAVLFKSSLGPYLIVLPGCFVVFLQMGINAGSSSEGGRCRSRSPRLVVEKVEEKGDNVEVVDDDEYPHEHLEDSQEQLPITDPLHELQVYSLICSRITENLFKGYTAPPDLGEQVVSLRARLAESHGSENDVDKHIKSDQKGSKDL